MESGLTDHVWTVEELLSLIPEIKTTKRGPYKKRARLGYSRRLSGFYGYSP